MKTAEAKAFRKNLELRQTELENGTRSRERLAVDANSDELDRIQDARERDFAIGSFERQFSRLREVSAALRRLDEGTFGVCGTCAEEINSKRLTAVPWASLCLVCQEAAERECELQISEISAPIAMAV